MVHPRFNNFFPPYLTLWTNPYLPPPFTPSCCEVRSWRSLANLNLSSCGLAQLPGTVSSLTSLRILRLSHNRLTALPPELSALTALEVLAADHNQLAALPGA